MELQKAKAIAEVLKQRLEPACERLEIAGSIRRRKPCPGDIELLTIPRYAGMVDQLDLAIKGLMNELVLGYRLNKNGHRAYGQKNKLLVHLPSGIGVDIFSTDPKCWWVSLVVRTGGEKTNKRIAMAAINKGWHLKAYGSGFSTPQGNIICNSEREVFELVELPYQEPWERA